MDWNLPSLTSLYTDAMTYMKERTNDVATMFRGSTSTNIPVGSIKWSDTNARFESWNGTIWEELETTYEIQARTATKWATGRTITLGTDLSGSVTLDGSSNVVLNASVINNSHTHDDRYYTEAEINTNVGSVVDFETELTTA